MNWPSDGAAAALIAARAVHFSATAIVAGTLLFRAVIAGPATAPSPVARVVVDRHTRWIAGIALVVAIASGVIWFVLTAAAMANVALSDALNPDNLATVLELTQFGSAAAIRFALAVVVGVGLTLDRSAPVRWLTLIASLAFAGSIAWTGHAGSGFGTSGDAQVVADVLHLLAASAWLGSLVPLALLLSHAGKTDSELWSTTAATVTQRYSALGITSVAVLIASGTINSFFLVGSPTALATTQYGRVLMAKLVLFGLMVAIAAVNRSVLTPQLAAPSRDARSTSQRRLVRHCVGEIGLGLAIITIVGWLGTLHPAAHFMQ